MSPRCSLDPLSWQVRFCLEEADRLASPLEKAFASLSRPPPKLEATNLKFLWPHAVLQNRPEDKGQVSEGRAQLRGTLTNSVVRTQGHCEPLALKLHVPPRPLSSRGPRCSGGGGKQTRAPHRLSRTRWARGLDVHGICTSASVFSGPRHWPRFCSGV